MEAGTNETLVRSVLHDVFNDHDLDRIEELFDEDYAHDGPIPAEYGVIEIFRIEDGKIAEHWQQSDALGLLGQLGVLPDFAEAADGQP